MALRVLINKKNHCVPCGTINFKFKRLYINRAANEILKKHFSGLKCGSYYQLLVDDAYPTMLWFRMCELNVVGARKFSKTPTGNFLFISEFLKSENFDTNNQTTCYELEWDEDNQAMKLDFKKRAK
jgi:hypothetical protein